MYGSELILAISAWANEKGVSFDIAVKMLENMYNDGVHLDDELEDLTNA